MDTLVFILRNEEISWILHFIIFYILSKWSGIKWQWAIILVFCIEFWEMIDWSITNPLAWWFKLDTWFDILSGVVAIFLVQKGSTNWKSKNS